MPRKAKNAVVAPEFTGPQAGESLPEIFDYKTVASQVENGKGIKQYVPGDVVIYPPLNSAPRSEKNPALVYHAFVQPIDPETVTAKAAAKYLEIPGRLVERVKHALELKGNSLPVHMRLVASKSGKGVDIES